MREARVVKRINRTSITESEISKYKRNRRKKLNKTEHLPEGNGACWNTEYYSCY